MVFRKKKQFSYYQRLKDFPFNGAKIRMAQ